MREWQTVTVALRASSICATGLPTRSERPITTASAPSSAHVVAVEQLHAARGRARPQPGPALGEQAGGDRREPVDVLRRVDHPRQPVAVDVLRASGAGAGCPETSRVAVELARAAPRPRPAACRPPAGGRSRACRPPSWPSACRRRRRRRPASSPTSTVASPGGSLPAATQAATSSATSLRTCSAIDFPSMICALMRRGNISRIGVEAETQPVQRLAATGRAGPRGGPRGRARGA